MIEKARSVLTNIGLLAQIIRQVRLTAPRQSHPKQAWPAFFEGRLEAAPATKQFTNPHPVPSLRRLYPLRSNASLII